MVLSTFDKYIPYITIFYRVSFLIGLLSLLFAKFVLPEFLQYGKTLYPIKKSDKKLNHKNSKLNTIIHYTVPKAYFAHFYILSTVLSLITCASYAGYTSPWLVLFHSIRRLYETLYVCKYTNKSRMNWSHYVVGIWFYSVLHIILNIKLKQGIILSDLHKYSSALFIIASWDQYMNHKVLSGLVKYSLPKDRLFKLISSPHYLDELLIYGSFISYNAEFLWLVVWIFTSLAISAIETQRYYKINFPNDKIAPYAFIPFLL